MSTMMFAPDMERAETSAMRAFRRVCEAATGLKLEDYQVFHDFSVGSFREFWDLLLQSSGLLYEGSRDPVCTSDDMEHSVFFPEVRLNYVENLLRHADADPDRVAVRACTESGDPLVLTRGELRTRVARLASALRRRGVVPGDRVVAVARNTADTTVACLAALSLGAIWSSVGTDLEAELVLARFKPLRPKVLMAHTQFPYQGRTTSLVERVGTLTAGLQSLELLVSLDQDLDVGVPAQVSHGALAELESEEPEARFEAPRFPFNHPLFILFSSGTTGAPKCIIHGAGGTLLEHDKELRLHTDLRQEDRLFVHTTAGWMMWNWQLSALLTGAELVLYDGAVSYPEADALWKLIGRERVTAFCTSPAYLHYCRDSGVVPKEQADLSSLRLMLSTGAVLFDAQYDWVAENVKPLALHSISGGTDILGCFVMGHPELPVYRGESPCVGLGFDVRALPPPPDTTGTMVPPPSEGLVGDLICATPFPSRPIGFFEDADGTKLHNAYFAEHRGVWTHGDRIELTVRGTARILGRTDGVLNVLGLRIGPAEIYHVLQEFPEITAAMALEQLAPREPGGSRMILLVVLAKGATLDRTLTLRVKKALRSKASPAHVPAVIASVSALAVTRNGKESVAAARAALNGHPVRNLGALRNPECLDEIRNHPALRLASD
ncbi:MAG: acetoacetate--CoA ligase [Myxococcales bacterium]